MHNELQPDSIRFTSDRIGFEGFRALVRELPDEAEVGSGKRGWPCFQFGWQPVPGKRRVMLRFDKAGPALAMSRISAILPPDEPHVCRWQRAAGRTVSFEVHPRFFEETLRLAGLAAARFRVVPPPRFVINRRVGWLCQMLMEETEAGCPGGRAYFEHVAAALLLAVGSQSDPRLPEPGDVGAQLRRIQPAVAMMEVDFAYKLSLEQLAAAAGLSPFHFSRLFSRLMGLSPHQYLMNRRLQHARRLLSAPGGRCSIAHVAIESGFGEQSHLGRLFRRTYGVSPSEFRQAQE